MAQRATACCPGQNDERWLLGTQLLRLKSWDEEGTSTKYTVHPSRGGVQALADFPQAQCLRSRVVLFKGMEHGKDQEDSTKAGQARWPRPAAAAR